MTVTIPASMTPDVRETIQEDGGLFNLGWYLGWNANSREATLDGRFNAADLRAIAFLHPSQARMDFARKVLVGHVPPA